MRTISIGYPSGKAKMTLWEGTEDEKKFTIRAVTSKNPHVIAYGKRYDLDDDEIKALRKIVWLPKELTEPGR